MESVNLLDSTWIVSCYVLATAKSMRRHLKSLKNSFKAGIIDMFLEGLVNVHSFQVITKTYLQKLNRELLTEVESHDESSCSRERRHLVVCDFDIFAPTTLTYCRIYMKSSFASTGALSTSSSERIVFSNSSSAAGSRSRLATAGEFLRSSGGAPASQRKHS